MSSSYKRHFRTIEESLFDSLSWKEGSILYQRVETIKTIEEQEEEMKSNVQKQQPETPLAKKKGSFMVFDSPGPNNQTLKKTKSHSLDVRK